MKTQKGINMVAIIIGVVIGLIIVAIGGFFILSNGNKQPQQPPVVEDEPQIEDTEITEEEKVEINEYLKKIAYVAIAGETYDGLQTTMTEEQAMIYMATLGLEKEETTNSGNNMQNTVNGNTNINSGINMNLTNTQNTNNLSNIPTIQGNTINNSLNSLDNTISNTINTENTLQGQNSLKLSEETIQNAVFEMFGQKLDNLTQVLQVTAEPQDLVLPYITQVEDIIKSNGIYTAVYSASPRTKEDVTNGTNVYGLTSYTIQVKFEKNDDPEYSNYKMSSMTVTNKIEPIAYHISYISDTAKYGVIDNNGIVIIEAKYSKVEIPNSYVGLFFCYTDETTPPVILNEKGIEQFKEYDSAELISSSAGGESYWEEVNILKVKQNGYYGAIDYKGNIIYEPEYEAIDALGYINEKLVLTQNGVQALADTKGNILSDFAYSKIGLYGGDFDLGVLNEQMLDTTKEYIIGQKLAGNAYEIIETQEISQVTPIMKTLAHGYDMTIGTSWQLAILGETIPVYVKQSIQ